MPVISRFYGITIKMYFIEGEHNPPHIHAVYGEYMGLIDLRKLKMLQGDLPPRALSIVLDWTREYQSELIKMWDTQRLDTLPPIN